MSPDNNGEGSNVSWFTMVDQKTLSDDVDLDTYEIDYPQVSFEESLEAIQADAIAPQDLLGFGDISRKNIHQLRAIWRSLPNDHRLVIAEVGLLIARENPYLDFGRFFRVLLEDESSEVRLQAAFGAAFSEDSALIQPLAQSATSDTDVNVRQAAIMALAPHVVAMDLAGLTDDRDAAQLLNLKVWSQDVTWPDDLRAAALQAYSHFSADNDTAGIIEFFVRSENETLQLGAMRAMAEYGAGKFTRFLERQLQSHDVDVREAAAAAMGMSDDEAVVPMLTMVAREDVEPSVREAAYLALGNIGTDAALRSLQQLRENASDDDIEVIDGAIQFASELRDMESGLDMIEFDLDETDQGE